ncbi:MAG TPA: hypothetical protein VH165_28065 [Kofleriaceae bacterium]|nr:hypothetical protein [Kofleriaceae bacterium]
MILLALGVAISGCSGAAKPGSAGTGEPMLAKKVALSWGIEPVPGAGPGAAPGDAMADVFLATTDETGKQISHPLGRYKGACTVIAPAGNMNAVSGVACRTGGTGTELHAVIQRGEDIVILKLGIDPGVTPDPMAREEVTRVKVPLGAKIEVGP